MSNLLKGQKNHRDNITWEKESKKGQKKYFREISFLELCNCNFTAKYQLLFRFFGYLIVNILFLYYLQL